VKKATLLVLSTVASLAVAQPATDPSGRATCRRAIEAINWGMPAVNLDLMLQAGIKAGAKPNQIVYWSRLPDWKIQARTPNPDVIYLKPLFNTKDVGPMVLEIPPAGDGSITGTIMGRQGVELDPDQRQWQVRSPVPRLRPRQDLLRQGLEAAGHRGDEMKAGIARLLPALALALTVADTVQAQASPPADGDAVPVTADYFIRAESDVVITGLVAQGGLGKFFHNRQLTPIDDHVVQRANRDTLYSTAVFDLDAGPVTITLPNPGKRFLTMIVIDEDHYVAAVVYGAGRHALSKANVGTRYVVAAIRILVDPNDPKDVAQVNALQDAVKVEQPGGPGKFEIPNWDPASHKKVRDALVVLGETLPDWRRAAGRRGEVDAVRHLIVTATGWGLNPDKDALYLNITPSSNDGTTVYKLNVKDVPVDGFWSISLYNAKGFFEPNNLNAYTLNNVNAKKAADGSVAVQFGGCDGKTPNCLPITKGWNYMVRLYRPRAEVLSGKWQFPQAMP
jgi:hypothetical protein